jgi:bacteriorhodopsin
MPVNLVHGFRIGQWMLRLPLLLLPLWWHAIDQQHQRQILG